MEITYATKKLEKVLNSESRIKRDYGDKNGRKIVLRLSVLAAAPNLDAVPKMPPPRCHQLKEDRDETFAVYLEHPYRLLFRATPPVPRLHDGGIDLVAVTRIVIDGIKDYH
jgi:plasmid maintenance system killer protein